MAYQVIARKWRPKSFSEVIGQNHICQTLSNAIANQRLAHALLFTGPRGTGKTSTARILAKTLRCPNVQGQTPCEECPSCKDISSGRSVDVIEIDGASNNGVDAIRELRETVGYRPATGNYKIYIIDEVHMLSTSAFNALLKTLEEPPEHVIFVLATTEVHKIPSTILSRCQKYDFRRVAIKEVVRYLGHICEKEGVKADQESLWALARQGGGSLRDSQSLLDQAITFCQGELREAKVMEVLGLADRSLLNETLQALINRESALLFGNMEKIFSAGYDPVLYVEDLLVQIRNLLIVKLNGPVPDLSDGEIESLKKLADQTTSEDIHLLFDMALKGAQDLTRASDQRIVLEMVLLRMLSAPHVLEIEKLLEGEPQEAERPQVRAATSVIAPPPPPLPPAEPLKPKTSGEQRWDMFVESLKQSSPIMAAKLENVSLVSCSGTKCVLGVPEKIAFLYQQIKEGSFLKELEQRLAKEWGEPYTVSVEMLGAKTASQSPRELKEKQAEQQRMDREKSVEEHPLVKATQKVFETKMRAIDDSLPTKS